MNDTKLIVFTTFPDPDSALKTARQIITNRLAACVNILPQITSVYEWENTVEIQQEHMLILKTSQHRFASLEQEIRRFHPYELPEIIATPISHGSKDYLDWIESQTIALTE
jgi:periplasmic divalent cation tolerance protein